MTALETEGLTSSEAMARLARDGANVLPVAKRPSAWRRLLTEFFRFFAIMLWIAAGLAFVAGLPELAVAIVGVIILNAIFATVQQTRADRAAERLREMLPAKVTVRRDGRRQDVEAVDVVIDDLVLLEGGDRIPADATVLQEDRLLVDSSMITGESAAENVRAGEALFAGTFVVEGEATARVTAVG